MSVTRVETTQDIQVHKRTVVITRQTDDCDDCGSAPMDAYISEVSSGGLTLKGRIESMELKEGQFVTATVSLKTKAGHPAAYQTGTESWESSDPAVEVTPNPDNPLSAKILSVDGSNNTAALITFKADGDPSADVTADVVATLDVVATQGNAVVAEISTDTPQDDTAPPA